LAQSANIEQTPLRPKMTACSASERDFGVVDLSDCVDRMLGEYGKMPHRAIVAVFWSGHAIG
jgi:hypothetical protein